MGWRDEPDFLDVFETYCAPTALSGLMGCSRREAAETLAAVPGLVHPRIRGAVVTVVWRKFLENELGLRCFSAKRTLTEHSMIVADRLRKLGWDQELIREAVSYVRRWYDPVKRDPPGSNYPSWYWSLPHSFDWCDRSFWFPTCLLYTSPSPRDKRQARMPSSA